MQWLFLLLSAKTLGIGHRTQPDRTPNAIRSGSERDPIRRRTVPMTMIRSETAGRKEVHRFARDGMTESEFGGVKIHAVGALDAVKRVAEDRTGES